MASQSFENSSVEIVELEQSDNESTNSEECSLSSRCSYPNARKNFQWLKDDQVHLHEGMLQRVQQYEPNHVSVTLAFGLLNEAKGDVTSALRYLTMKIAELMRLEAADTPLNAIELLNKYEGSVTYSMNEYQSGLAIIEFCAPGNTKKVVRDFYIAYHYDPLLAIQALKRLQKMAENKVDTLNDGGDRCYICDMEFARTGPNRRGNGICSSECNNSLNLCHSCNHKWWKSTWGRNAGCPYCKSPLRMP